MRRGQLLSGHGQQPRSGCAPRPRGELERPPESIDAPRRAAPRAPAGGLQGPAELHRGPCINGVLCQGRPTQVLTLGVADVPGIASTTVELTVPIHDQVRLLAGSSWGGARWLIGIPRPAGSDRVSARDCGFRSVQEVSESGAARATWRGRVGLGRTGPAKEKTSASARFWSFGSFDRWRAKTSCVRPVASLSRCPPPPCIQGERLRSAGSWERFLAPFPIKLLCVAPFPIQLSLQSWSPLRAPR